jgi:tetratricopeptide (TPR) repeat protein
LDLGFAMTSHALSSDTYDRIKAYCSEGDRRCEEGEFDAALEMYKSAWNLVPEKKGDWEASTWILAATGDVFLRKHDYVKALNLFCRAVQCPGGLGNPYIHLRLGEMFFETGEMERAAEELTRAFMGAGDDIFEQEDPKYLKFLRTVLRAPE